MKELVALLERFEYVRSNKNKMTTTQYIKELTEIKESVNLMEITPEEKKQYNMLLKTLFP